MQHHFRAVGRHGYSDGGAGPSQVENDVPLLGEAHEDLLTGRFRVLGFECFVRRLVVITAIPANCAESKEHGLPARPHADEENVLHGARGDARVRFENDAHLFAPIARRVTVSFASSGRRCRRCAGADDHGSGA